MRRRLDLWRVIPQVVAPVGAVVIAAAVSSVALLASGKDPLNAFSQMLSYGVQPDSIVSILDHATPYYLAAVAVAVGFRMNLFNIGVDGQYRLAGLLAAAPLRSLTGPPDPVIARPSCPGVTVAGSASATNRPP